jgi:hypothetical protein
MNRKIFQIDCHKIVIGTAPGTEKDARAFVEAQIDRYFDLPKRCSYRVKKFPGYGFHFEIQQESISGSILDRILDELRDEEEGEDKEGTELLVLDASGHQYRIFKRVDGSLRTFFLDDSENRRQEIEYGAVLIEGSQGKFRDYYSTLTSAMVVLAVCFGLSFVPVLAGLSVVATKSSIENGYQESVKHGPLSFVFDSGSFPDDIRVPAPRTMPVITGWRAVAEHELSGEGQIKKLVYDGSRWIVESRQETMESEDLKTLPGEVIPGEMIPGEMMP